MEVTDLEGAERRATRAARLISAAGPVFLREAGEREFSYQAEIRGRQRRDATYRDPRSQVVDRARTAATEAGRHSQVARAMEQLSQHAFDFITDADTVGDDYEEQPGDRLRWGTQRKASERRAYALRKAAEDLILAAAVRDFLTEAEFRMVWLPFESAVALDAFDEVVRGQYGPNTKLAEAFIAMLADLKRQDLRELFRDCRSGKDSYVRAMYLIDKAAAFTGLKKEVDDAQRVTRHTIDNSEIQGGTWNQSSWFQRAFNEDLERMHRYGRNEARERGQRAVAALVVRQVLAKADFDWLFWPFQRRFSAWE